MLKMTLAELDAQSVELLPTKETLFFDSNWAAVYASNSSAAVNVATILSAANSAAVQNIAVVQG
ncbi:hypothetical protein ACFWN7_12130 [Agromyces sp. NPDC058484]|uniref:hypothetical protein n=1 Tax=Agromyces sp. NPDC058484 TaxID=3346524 RepID=UPI003646C372